MDIHQFTANITGKQIQLKQQISHLQQQLNAANGESAEILSEQLRALEGLQQKLIKSYAMALQAHALQANLGPRSQHLQNQRRIIGFILCIFSGLGLLSLIMVALLL